MAKDYKHTIKGTLWSGIFSFPFFAITGLIGIVALSLKPDLNPNLSMPFVINEVLPVGLKGIVIAGMISIVMSSADSFLNAASVAFIHDIITPLKKQEMSSNQKLLAVRIITIFVGVFAIVFAIKIKSILDILLYSYNFWSPVILVPLVSAILGLKTNKKQFFIGAIAGIAGVIIWSFVLKKPFGIDGLIIGLSCNFFAFFTAYFINKK